MFAALLGLVCGRSFLPESYLPLRAGQTWTYQGRVSALQVNGGEERDGCRYFTLQFLDSAGSVLSKEIYFHKGNQIYWEAYQPVVPLFPAIRFDPPIPIGPFSERPGDKKMMQLSEMRSDGASVPVRITLQIEDAGAMNIGGILYKDCIKQRMEYVYLDQAATPYFAGNHVMWFARGTGIVRFSLPSGEGRLVRTTFSPS